MEDLTGKVTLKNMWKYHAYFVVSCACNCRKYKPNMSIGNYPAVLSMDTQIKVTCFQYLAENFFFFFSGALFFGRKYISYGARLQKVFLRRKSILRRGKT